MISDGRSDAHGKDTRRHETIIWAPLQQMTPRLSCTNQAFMSLQTLIGTATPSWQST
jgi:hypothetical protein